jgi:hypothetical protein
MHLRFTRLLKLKESCPKWLSLRKNRSPSRRKARDGSQGKGIGGGRYWLIDPGHEKAPLCGAS